MKRRTESQARSVLRERLQARRPEIEEAALVRVQAIAELPAATRSPEYAEGLQGAISAAIDFGLAAIDSREGDIRPSSVPMPLIAQARLAARLGIDIDVVLRRYVAGYALFGDFIVKEATDFTSAELKGLLSSKAAYFDRLVAAVSEEYRREQSSLPRDHGQYFAGQVRRLLDGEPTELDAEYDFEVVHVGLVAVGHGASKAIRELSRIHDRRLLMVSGGGASTWAWLGGRRPPDLNEIGQQLISLAPPAVSVALGEPDSGLNGWRLTHRQACAALPVALRRDRPFIRYSEVALLASHLQDDLLKKSLSRLFLEPLERDRRDDGTLRATLSAYIACERNVSSTAAQLGVRRHTVASRLRLAEERVGRPLKACLSEIEAALQLADLDAEGSGEMWSARRSIDDHFGRVNGAAH